MKRNVIRQRKRIYCAVEGEGEQSFIKFLQNLSDQEELRLHLMPGNERQQPNAASAHKQLLKVWHDYQKPTDAHTLMRKFSLKDLRRVADSDTELKILLTTIGLCKK